MLRFRLRAIGFLSLVLAATTAGAEPNAPSEREQRAAPTPVIGAYYAGWSSSSYPVSQIPADTITHLFYAFATINNGQCAAPAGADANFSALATLKQQHPKLRTLISIGGWGAGGFSDAALTQASRQRFVSSCVDTFFNRYRGSFDGIDLDWEFPVSGGPVEITDRPEDKQNMTLLSQEFRRQLDSLGQQRGAQYLVTAALPAGRLQTDGPYDPAASFDLGALGGVLDFINLMTYDMGTGFSSVSTFNAPMSEVAEDPLGQPMRKWNNVSNAVAYYRQNGVPAERIVLGVPFYGRGFVVQQEGPNHGLYQSKASTFEVGAWKDIQPLLSNPAWKQYWHSGAQSPWLYNAAERKFASFENPESIAIRARFAKQNGLLGTFMWELSEDDASHSLLNAMSASFK